MVRSHSSRLLQALSISLTFFPLLGFPLLATETPAMQGARHALFAPLLEQYHADLLLQLRPLLTEEEAEAFKNLRGHERRMAFIEAFWRYHDPTKDDARNPLQERWQEQVRNAQRKYPDLFELSEDRVRVRMVAGTPTLTGIFRCGELRPMEIWYYDLGEHSMYVAFVTTERLSIEKVELWWPERGTHLLSPRQSSWNQLSAEALSARLWKAMQEEGCGAQQVATNYFFEQALSNGVDWQQLYAQVDVPYPTAGTARREWLSTTMVELTAMPDTDSLDSGRAKLDWRFGDDHEGRTLVEARVEVPLQELGVAEPNELALIQVDLVGDLWRQGAPIDNFRFSFHSARLSKDGAAAELLLLRALKPGNYQLLLRGTHDGATLFRRFIDLNVPVAKQPEATTSAGSATGREADLSLLVDNANVSIFGQYSGIRILHPASSLIVDEIEIVTLPVGVAIRSVELLLDGVLVARMAEPPFTATIDVGREPRRHTLEAIAFDAAGQQVARDEVKLNVGWHHFDIRLLQPDGLQPVGRHLQAHAEVNVPREAQLDRVDFYLDDQLTSTLYEEPFSFGLEVRPETRFVRAVAHLRDGRSVEAVRLLQARGEMDEIDVQLVEVYVSVKDGSQPVTDLKRENFELLERGEPQTLQRFEYIDNLPVNVIVLMDTSSSMRDNLGAATASSLSFIDAVLTERDQAAFLEFNHRAELTAPFTNNLEYLRLATTSIGASGGTRLYDSVIQAMYYFAGVEGKRALVLISDGKDEHSHFSDHQMVEYGLRSGVAVYVISLQQRLGNPRSNDERAHRRILQELAEATGGRYFHVSPGTDLDTIYEQIRNELRSQYLLTFHAPEGPPGLRQVKVEVDAPGRRRVKIRARRGYIAN